MTTNTMLSAAIAAVSLSYVFHFRNIADGSDKKADIDELLAQRPELADAFESVKASGRTKAGIKRKPVTVELTMPEFYSALPDDTLRSIVRDTVADYVRSTYLDEFKPVGDHSWETIAKAMAETGTRTGGAPEADKDQLAAGEAVFAAYAAEAMPRGAAKLAGLITKKAAKTALLRIFGTNYTPETLAVLIAKVEECVSLNVGDDTEDSNAGLAVALYSLRKQKRDLESTSLSAADLLEM